MLSLLFQEPLLFVVLILAILVALTVHEFSHALVATRLGDQTAARLGRVTLNPIAHLDPLGFLAMLFAGFGWAKPVPFNTYNLKNQKWGPVMIAFAGPTANVVCALAFGLILRFFGSAIGDESLLTQALFLLVNFNLALLFFNLIPIPPLDGSKLLLALLASPQYAKARNTLETKGPLILLGAIIADNFLNLNVFSFISGIVGYVAGRIIGF